MNTVRINVSLPKDAYAALLVEVEARGRSRFISDAVNKALKERRNRRLETEYREAAEEIRRINTDLEGAVADGID